MAGPAGAESEVIYRVTVQGRVTGVGFRFTAVYQAQQRAGLTGYVRNVDASTVECVVRGPESSVSSFLKWLRHGPPGARVDVCHVIPVNACEPFTHFGVRY